MAKILPTKPFLIMLYGFPGSGKTYFARQLAENIQAAHVQSDRIRSELFEKPRYDKQENEVVAQLMDYMTEEFLSAGLSVIYDANALRLSQRHALRELARKNHATPLLMWFQIDAESAYARSTKRDRRRADDKYAAQWDRETYKKILGYMQNPSVAEEYVVISGKHLYATQQNAAVSKLRHLGLLSSEDASANVAKPGMVNLVPANQNNSGRVDMTRRNINIR
ncbi:MAG: ATP-binding protein [Patescibacteria group bacterium]|nr:ATP-binding protein [Patescibacteria group bacterium]